MAIHSTAIIHETAKLHDSVEVGPYALIGEGVTIGEGSSVGAHTFIEFSEIGKNNRIFHHASVGTEPQDLKFKGEVAPLRMGDNNTIREYCQINRGTKATGETRIGSNGLFCSFTHVAHDCVIGDHVIMVSFAALAGHVHIGDGAILSAHVGIHQFVRIGKGAMLSAGSAVGKDVPPYCVTQGDRAVLRGVNVVGLRRSGLPLEDVKSVRRAYRDLFLSGGSLEDGIRKARAHNPSPPA
ncbi:MAG: acyl-[acyl-carrier-protein]--UDP-N-acetylglucosamine O-acyltransferase, partial [Elusimicrobia bacterium]